MQTVAQALAKPTETLQKKSEQKEQGCSCNGIGYYRLDVDVHDPRFGKVLPCPCVATKSARVLQSKFGSVLNENTLLSNFRNRGEGSKKMTEIGREFIENPTGFISVFGGIRKDGHGSANGNGKTTWSQALVNECLAKGVSALYVTASDLMEYINAGIENNDVDKRMAIVSNADVLVIDELTQVRWSEWVEDKLTSVIDRRYKAKATKGTILIMDESPTDKLHKRIVSRMREGIVIKNSDTDLRPSFGQQENLL